MAHKEIDLKNPKSNRKNADLPMKKEANLIIISIVDLWIPSDIFILIKWEHIHGGPICLMQDRIMQDGE